MALVIHVADVAVRFPVKGAKIIHTDSRGRSVPNIISLTL